MNLFRNFSVHFQKLQNRYIKNFEYETPKNVCIFVVNSHIACKRNRAWLSPCNFRKRKQELDRHLASLTHDPATLYELKLNTSYFIGNKEQPRDTYVLYVIIAYRLPI